MSRRTEVGLVIIVVLLIACLVYGWRAKPDPARTTLLVTVVMCGVTAIYALLTLGILRENRAMARASTDATALMERSLRFSFAPHLLYWTLCTKDPKLQAYEGFTPVDNQDLQTALRQNAEGQQQSEFVFAIVQNVGRGSVTNMNIDARYTIWDSSNPNKNYTVTKAASIQILEPTKAVALCIFVSKVPTADDRVEIISTTLTTSDFYRDALHEPPQKMSIDHSNHHTNSESGCVIRMA